MLETELADVLLDTDDDELDSSANAGMADASKDIPTMRLAVRFMRNRGENKTR